MSKKTVVFDFDGVIHKYSDGWRGINNIYDEPVPGIKEIIDKLRNENYEVVIVSTRSSEEIGKKAIYNWLEKYNIQVDYVCSMKPPAICYIDDRAISFNGNIKGLYQKIISFENWIVKENKYAKMNEAEMLGNLIMKKTEFAKLADKIEKLAPDKTLELFDKWNEIGREYLGDDENESN